ncbi:uncharacterized protein LY89DRAFT_553279, partial [Mollisia scopiformis]
MAIKRHIRNLLAQAGLPVGQVEKTAYQQGDYSVWEVVDDSTIEGPEDSPYQWAQIEIRSPIKANTQASLDEVQKVCDLLKASYHIETNQSTGLHVHVGRGSNSFEHQQIRNLIAFYWVFEEQIKTALGQFRSQSTMAQFSRDNSRYAHKYWQNNAHHTKAENVTAWIADQANPYRDTDKYTSLNLTGVREEANQPGRADSKPTVEFRSHEGSIEGVRVINWIKAVVGMV